MAVESGGSTTATPSRLRRSLVPILLGIGVVLISYAWLSHINPAFPITDDGVRDQLMARDCVELGRCARIGPLTSVPGFHQGAVWLDLLIGVRLAGGNVAAARTVVLGLLAVGVGTCGVIVWRWLRPTLALPAAAILLAGMSLDTYPSQLINPSGAALPDILTAGGLLCYGLSGKIRYAILAALALGLAVNVHVGSLSLVPSLVAVVALAGPRPLRRLLAASGVLVATCLLTSPAAMVANVDGLESHGRLLPVFAGVVAVLLCSAWLRSWFCRLSRVAQAWLIGVILIAPFGAGLLWLTIWQRHGFGFTYLHPVLAPAAALAAALVSTPFEWAAGQWQAAGPPSWWRQDSRLMGLGRMFRWIPTAVALGGLAWIACLAAYTPRATDPSHWTLADATAIADAAMTMGWGYEQLVFRVQSRACRELVVGMSVEAPPPATGAAAKERTQLQVLRATRDRLATLRTPADAVALESGEVAILREVDSWLQPDTLLACRVPLGSSAAVCVPARAGTAHPGNLERFLFGTRSFPEIHSIDLPPPYVARYEIPLSPVAGERRDFVLADDTLPGCGWRITRVDGARVEGSLPANRARLASDTGAPGLLVLEKAFGTPACPSDIVDRRYPPCILETQPADPPRPRVEGR